MVSYVTVPQTSLTYLGHVAIRVDKPDHECEFVLDSYTFSFDVLNALSKVHWYLETPDEAVTLHSINVLGRPVLWHLPFIFHHQTLSSVILVNLRDLVYFKILQFEQVCGNLANPQTLQ